MNKVHKELLKKNFEKACNDYVAALLDMWELDSADYYGYWIGDEVGGIYDYGDGTFTISMEEIVYCVENNITREEYTENLEYCIKCAEYNLPVINLKSWHMGAPRISQERFDWLDSLKKSLDDEIDKLKEQF